ncbi:MAG TPA: tRNA pseudouridine(55) synthase TruB, partial [Pseudonocardiaceae bacterium]|nr:tRNA pseudouridine(55) synthase TruB [Pseudonocardiaceae bacterium]
QLSLGLDDSVALAFPRRDVDEREAMAVAHGQRLAAAGLPGTYGVFDPDGHVIALARDEGTGRAGHANPLVVLAPAG